MRRFLHISLCIIALLTTHRAFASFPRNVAFDVGGGVPNLAFVQGQAKVDEHWQVGLGYGLLGIVPLPVQTLPSQTVNLGLAGNFSIAPQVTPGLASLLPFVRYFPSKSHFYVQLATPLMELTGDIVGVMTSTSGFPAAATLSGKIEVLQPMATISVGDVWTGEFYFIQVNIGMSFFLPALSRVSLTGGFPQVLGDTAANNAAISQIATSVQSQVATINDQIRAQYPIVPSFSLSIGFQL